MATLTNAERLRQLLDATDGRVRPNRMRCGHAVYDCSNEVELQTMLHRLNRGEFVIISRELAFSILRELEAGEREQRKAARA